LPGTGFADDLKHKLKVLKSHREDGGRDHDAIEKMVSTVVDPDEDDLGTDHHGQPPDGPGTRPPSTGLRRCRTFMLTLPQNVRRRG